MLAISLQSGSNGNCIYVEADGVRVLFDAGISGKQAMLRLAEYGRDIRAVDALVISHDHANHVRSCGIFQRKFGLPVYATRGTLAAAGRWGHLGAMAEVRHFEAGSTLRIGPVAIETVPTAHDGADGVAFVVQSSAGRLGILTDLGHPFAGLDAVLQTLDAVFLESNYDPDMLERGPYSYALQERIRGERGHLSNAEAGRLLRPCVGGRLRWACLAHLSENNNEPELALRTCREMVGAGLPLHVASRYGAAGVFEV